MSGQVMSPRVAVAATLGALCLTIAPVAHASTAVLPAPEVPQQTAMTQRSIIALSSCSAGLVAFPTTVLSGKAMMLTNGHCMFGGKFPKMGEVAVDQRTNLRGNILDDNGKNAMAVRGTKILYGTMTDTDAAIVELDVTYEHIKQQTGFDPLIIANRKPQVGDALVVNSGYWRTMYNCPMVKEVHRLKEGQYVWKEAVKYQDSCGTKPGTSGSPVMDSATGEVVAVNNTGNESGERCTSNNPCEIDEDGNIFAKRGTNYGTQVQWFNTCLNNVGRIDLNVVGCVLPKPAGFVPTPTPTTTPTVTPTTTPTVTPTGTPNPTPTATTTVAPTPTPTSTSRPFPWPWPWPWPWSA